MILPGIRNALWHVAGWLLFLSFIVAFALTSKGSDNVWDFVGSAEVLVFAFTYIGIYYLNARVFFPILYLQRKYFSYFGIFLLLFGLVYFIRPFDNLMHSDSLRVSSFGGPAIVVPFGSPISTGAPGGPPEPITDSQPLDIMSMVMFLLVWSLGSAFRLTRAWQSEKEKAAIAEAQKANAELAFLKAQINPHFLYNTLNNIYALAISNSPNTAPSVMMLSKMMRYVTDDVRNDFVPLASEVECIEEMIELQKLKLNKKTTIDYKVEGSLEGKQIAPLTLVPFVENVFKYGISNHEESIVSIHLDAKPDELSLFCRNTIYPNKKNGVSTGIGIENTRKRLQLLYPDKHELKITKDNNQFTVQLTFKV